MTVAGEGPASLANTGAPNVVFGITRCAIYLWAFCESYSYYRKLQRQAALGFGNPVVAQQILFWGIAAIGMGSSALLMIVRNQMGFGEEVRDITVGSLTPLVLSLTGTVSAWCAFFPPRFLRDRASASQAVES